jgi:hypothetical protein
LVDLLFLFFGKLLQETYPKILVNINAQKVTTKGPVFPFWSRGLKQ